MRAFKIFEKFTEENDPIKDLGIGLYSIRHFIGQNAACDFLVTHLATILGKKRIPKDIIKSEEHWINQRYDEAIDSYVDNYMRIEPENSYNDCIKYELLHYKLMKMGYRDS